MKKWIAFVTMLLVCLSAFSGVLAAEATVQPGDIITMGTYEQDNDLTNGKEPIEWIVLEVKDGKAFLFSRYCLDTHVFNEKKVSVIWQDCDLRRWLNGEFHDTVFTAEEQAKIQTVMVPNLNIVDDPISDTEERVYLLNNEEMEHYFPVRADRLAFPTPYCITRGCYVSDDTGVTWYWLRSPGDRPVDASGVRSDGRISGYGSRDVNRPSGTIRPCIWIALGE